MADYDSAMQAGKQLRAERRFAEARAQFDAAAAAAAPGSPPFALARYFAGLTCQDHGQDTDAVAPLEDAVRIYAGLPAETRGAALIGAALGLSLLRARRWADAARVLAESNQRLGNSPENARSLAAGLHNLAMACARGGDARRGVAAARQAVALRESLDGQGHPLTIETLLILAFAHIELGELDLAKPLIRRAASAVLSGAGEAHQFFADVLLTEARRVARTGDGCGAEALARRALFILGQIGTAAAERAHREHDAATLGLLWRTGTKARDAGDVALWRVSMQHTLWRYQVATLDFAGSGDQPKEWFFFVPASWPLDQARYAARLAFAAANMVLNSREPGDANYLDATEATASVPRDQELRDPDFAAAFRARVWEPSIAYSVVKGDLCLPLSPTDFARALAARGLPDAPLLPLCADAAILAAARSDPRGTLNEVLVF